MLFARALLNNPTTTSPGLCLFIGRCVNAIFYHLSLFPDISISTDEDLSNFLGTPLDVFLKTDPMAILRAYVDKMNLRLIDIFTAFDKDKNFKLSTEEFKNGVKVLTEFMNQSYTILGQQYLTLEGRLLAYNILLTKVVVASKSCLVL
jgi:hypothetical protein